jgi:hypothetical protein
LKENPSLPGLTRQSILFERAFCRLMDARIKSAHDTCGRAQHLPALNPHLTKSRLNDAPRLCDMLCRNFYRGASCAGLGSNVPPPRTSSNAAKGNKVELFWMQGE